MTIPYLDESTDLEEYPPTGRRKRRKRIRKLTLAQAIKQARNAGIDAGVISVDGVTLEFGSKSHDGIKLPDKNEWDAVQ
jgi:hypothetical protein